MSSATPPLVPPLGPVQTWVFDLDNTLYPATSSLFPQIDRRMRRFIVDRLGLDDHEAHLLQKRYYREYGTTLRGLMLVQGIDPVEFLDYVHDIDHGALRPDPRLAAVLERLEGRKLVFTNGSARHAEAVLARLGIASQVEAVFDIRAAGYIPKPQPEGYRVLVERHGFDPAGALMVEDLHHNLRPAAALGMRTLWVREEDHPDGPIPPQDVSDLSHVDYITDDLVSWLEAAAA
jgi:putative hydrolase of the HAD superfamily